MARFQPPAGRSRGSPPRHARRSSRRCAAVARAGGGVHLCLGTRAGVRARRHGRTYRCTCWIQRSTTHRPASGCAGGKPVRTHACGSGRVERRLRPQATTPDQAAWRPHAPMGWAPRRVARPPVPVVCGLHDRPPVGPCGCFCVPPRGRLHGQSRGGPRPYLHGGCRVRWRRTRSAGRVLGWPVWLARGPSRGSHAGETGGGGPASPSFPTRPRARTPRPNTTPTAPRPGTHLFRTGKQRRRASTKLPHGRGWPHRRGWQRAPAAARHPLSGRMHHASRTESRRRPWRRVQHTPPSGARSHTAGGRGRLPQRRAAVTHRLAGSREGATRAGGKGARNREEEESGGGRAPGTGRWGAPSPPPWRRRCRRRPRHRQGRRRRR